MNKRNTIRLDTRGRKTEGGINRNQNKIFK